MIGTMEWYYACDGDRRGPVTTFDIRELKRTGVLDDDSLVWNETLDDWRALKECAIGLEQSQSPDSGSSIDSTATSPSEEPMAVCAWSHRTMPQSSMLRYGDAWVAPEYKDLFVQQLQEGGSEFGDRSGIPSEEMVPDLSLASIVTQSAKIWWANIVSIAVVTIVIWMPLNLILEYIAYQQTGVEETMTDVFKGIQSAVRLDRIAEFWIGVIATGGIIWVANQFWEGQPKARIGAIFRSGFENWGRMFITRFLFGLLMVVIIIPGVILISIGEPVAIGLGGIYLIVAVFIFLVRLAFAEMAAICDEAGGSSALARSRAVTKGHFWRIVGYQLAVFGVIFALAALIGLSNLIPIFDNFVVSAITSTFINLLGSFGTVEMLVFFRHLDANQES